LAAILSTMTLVISACRVTESTLTPSSKNVDQMMDHSTMSLGPADAEYDLRFMDAMIPHHEGAVVMAKDVLAKSKRTEMQQLANNIIASQQTEIDQMKQWRKMWYGN